MRWIGALLILILATGATTAEPDVTAAERTVADWYALGGWIMHLLVACSVLAGAILLERLVALRRSAVAPRALVTELSGDPLAPSALRDACDRVPSSLGRIVSAGASATQRGLEHPLDPIAFAGETEAKRLRRNLPLLAAIANVATMLGLLGTVLGMIAAFDRIAAVGTGDARVVARGIFQALVTTAAGLSVGIATLSAHAFLRRRVEQHLLTFEQIVQHLFGSQEHSQPAHSAGLSPAPAQR